MGETKTEPSYRDLQENLTACGGEIEELKRQRGELAHALYTVAMHLQRGATQLALDRIRGAAVRCPSLLDDYPALRDV